MLLVFGLFLFSLQEILSPFLLFLLVVALTLPFRDRHGYALLLTVATILILLWILDTTGFLLAPFVVALVLAYMLDPLVDVLSKGRLSRSLAILTLTLPAFGVIALATFVGIPALGDQVGELISQAPVLVERMADWLEGLEGQVLRFDIPVLDEEAIVASIREIDSQSVVAFLEARRAEIAGRVWGGVLGLGKGVGSVLTILGYLVLTPVLTFYLLRDYDLLTAKVASLLPGDRKPWVVRFAKEYDELLSRYLRGQFTVALIVGLLTALGLWVARFPNPFLIGALVAVLSVVPYLGLFLSLIPAIVIALLSGSIGLSLLKVAIVFGLVQGLEGAVISPRIVGESVGLHPVWVVLALSVGGFFFGFLGFLISVPIAVGVKLLVVRGIEHYRSTELFRGSQESLAD